MATASRRMTIQSEKKESQFDQETPKRQSRKAGCMIRFKAEPSQLRVVGGNVSAGEQTVTQHQHSPSSIHSFYLGFHHSSSPPTVPCPSAVLAGSALISS